MPDTDAPDLRTMLPATPSDARRDANALDLLGYPAGAAELRRYAKTMEGKSQCRRS